MLPKINWCQASVRGMEAEKIVPVNPIPEQKAQVFQRREIPATNEFLLHGLVERLRHGVVCRGPGTGKASDDSVPVEKIVDCLSAEFHPAVGVKDHHPAQVNPRVIECCQD